MKEIRQGLVFAGLVLAAAFLGRLAVNSGLIDDPDVSTRASMVVLGFFFVATGNALPKVLKPLREGRCDGAKTQAFQRFHGWTWVIMGLTYALVWMTLPVDLAEPVGVLVILSATLIVATRLFLLWRTSRRHA